LFAPECSTKLQCVTFAFRTVVVLFAIQYEEKLSAAYVRLLVDWLDLTALSAQGRPYRAIRKIKVC